MRIERSAGHAEHVEELLHDDDNCLRNNSFILQDLSTELAYQDRTIRKNESDQLPDSVHFRGHVFL